MRLDDGLRGRLEERAVLEGRSLANLIERLLELGLGTVVTERDGHVAATTGIPVRDEPLAVASVVSRSVAAGFDAAPAAVVREFKPDFKVGTKL
jgi:hypothetical protein